MKLHNGFSVFGVCLFTLFLFATKSYSFTCPNPPVKLGSDGLFYNTIMLAYGAAATDDSVMLEANPFEEDMNFNSSKIIVLDGGYDDCSFSNNSLATRITGSLTISGGTVTVSNIVLASPPPLADADGDGYSAIGSCVGSGDDCNDNDPNIHPYGEIYGDGINQDCISGDVTASEQACINCHGLASVNGISTNPYANYHVSVSAPDSSCVDCHAGQVNTVLPGHYGLTIRTDGNNMIAGEKIGCNSCHDQAPPLSDEHNFGNNFVSQRVQDYYNTYGNITCDACHESRATGHETATAHNDRNIESSCGQCHGPLDTQTDVDVLHRNDCALCHAYTGTKICADTVRQVIADGLDGIPVSCLDCHAAHHGPDTNNVNYNPSVDTSQSSRQGCAVCHNDYDIVNGTSVGLSIWNAILFEHDLDGTKDGSASACSTCHGSSKPTVIDVIASGAPATCASCHADKVPDVEHGIPTSAKHPEHLEMLNVGCSTCHLGIPYFKSGIDSNEDGLYNLAETDVCYTCHQDGSGNPATDEFKDGWHDPGFVLTCGSCHALAPPTGTHSAHYGGADPTLIYGDLRITQDFSSGQRSSVNMIGCGNCHPLDLPFHGDGTWGNVELANPAAAAGTLKSRSSSGSYDQATGTCSNIYCHSVNSWRTENPYEVPAPWPQESGWDFSNHPAAQLPYPLPDNIATQRIYKDATWGNTLSCNGCHENPPQTSFVDNDGGAGDSHYWIDQYGYENLHIYNMGNFPPLGCRTCHYATVQEYDETQGVGWGVDPTTHRRFYNDVPIYDKAKHVNGSKDVAFDTVNNFTYTSAWSGGSTPIDLSLASFDSATKTCSNVGCHIEETMVTWGMPYRWENSTECDRCHNYSGAFGTCSDCHSPQ